MDASIIAKLGHALPEIRARALDNVISKLRSGIVSREALVSAGGADLLRNLLSWFDHDEVPRPVELLRLLAELATHAPTAQQFVRLDALRIAHIIKLDAAQPAIQTALDDFIKVLSAHLPDHIPPAPIVDSISSRNPPSYQAEAPPHEKNGSTPPAQRAATSSSSFAPIRPRQPVHLTELGVDSDDDGWRFPMVALVRHDERILFDLGLRLRSRDRSIVVEALHTLHNDVLLDFPGEVILQRPQVLAAIVDLICSGFDLHVPVAAVLSRMVHSLFASLRMLADPSSRPPPTPAPVVSLQDDEFVVEEFQYPPRGTISAPSGDRRRTYRESLVLRSNVSINAFARHVIDTIIAVLKSIDTVFVYAPMIRKLIQFLPSVSPSRFDALASALLFHVDSDDQRSADCVLVLSYLVVEMAGADPLPDFTNDVLGRLLCSEAFGSRHPSLRERIFRTLSRSGHKSSKDFALSRAIISSLEGFESTSPDAIRGALDGVAYFPDLLPAVVRALLEYPDDDSLIVHALQHRQASVRLRVLKGVALERVAASEDILRCIIVFVLSDEDPDVANAARDLLLDAVQFAPAQWKPKLGPFSSLLGLYSTIEEAGSSAAALAAIVHDHSFRGSIEEHFHNLRLLFHTDSSVRRSAITFFSGLCDHICRRHMHMDASDHRIVARVLAQGDPFGIGGEVSSPVVKPTSIGAVTWKEEDVRNLIKILSNPNLELPLRASSAEQLSRIFDDPDERMRYSKNLFDLTPHLLDQLRSSLFELLVPQANDCSSSSDSLLLHCLRILHQACRQATRFPESAGDEFVHEIITAVTPFVFDDRRDVRSVVASIVALAVFRPSSLGLQKSAVWSHDDDSVEFALPISLTKTFSLPCSCRVRITALLNVPEGSSCDRNDVVYEMVEYHCRHKSNVNPDRVIERLLSNMARSSSLSALSSSARALHAVVSCCATDAASEADYSPITARFLHGAVPATSDDDEAVVAVLDTLSCIGAHGDVVDLVANNVLPVALDRLERSDGGTSGILLQGTLDCLFRLIGSADCSQLNARALVDGLLALLSKSAVLSTSQINLAVYAISELPASDKRDLPGIASQFLSTNRLPNSFVGRLRLQSALNMITSYSLPEDDGDSDTARWAWRLVTDRNSSIRAQGIAVLSLLSDTTAMAPAGSDLISTCAHYAADSSQAPVVRQAALSVLSALPDTADLSLIPALLRSSSPCPLFSLSILRFVRQMLLDRREDALPLVAANLSHVLRRIDVATIRRHLVSHVQTSVPWLAQSANTVWEGIQCSIAIDGALVAIDICRVLDNDELWGNGPLIAAIVSLFRTVARQKDSRVPFVVDFLLRVDASAALSAMSSDATSPGCLPMEFLVDVEHCLDCTDEQVKIAVCDLITTISRAAIPIASSTNIEILPGVMSKLASLFTARQGRTSYYATGSSASGCNNCPFGRALASLSAVCPKTKCDETFKTVLWQCSRLHALWVARRATNGDTLVIESDLRSSVSVASVLFYNCSDELKELAFDTMGLGPLLSSLWRVEQMLRYYLIAFTQNVLARSHFSKLVLSGLSERQKRVSIVKSLIAVATGVSAFTSAAGSRKPVERKAVDDHPSGSR